MKCNETLDKWCKNKHGASKIMDTLETYQVGREKPHKRKARNITRNPNGGAGMTSVLGR
jgi:hypothetical protein